MSTAVFRESATTQLCPEPCVVCACVDSRTDALDPCTWRRGVKMLMVALFSAKWMARRSMDRASMGFL
eukprot:4122076-Ditylum_brightwellii.AAC.1